MSELSGVLAVAANNEAAVFGLSAETQSLLFYALDIVSNYRNWVRGPLDELTDTDKAQISDLIDNASYEVMNAVNVIPIGTIAMYGGGAVPSKWLTCTGDAVLRADYPDLFDAIGEFFGPGNGTTTFNVPDFRDKIPMGVLGSVVPDIGDSAGALMHTLTTPEIPSHSHAISDPGHVHSITDPGHTHPPLSPATVFQGSHAGGAGGYAAVNASRTVDQPATTGSQTTGISVQSHSTGITATNNAGSGDAHSILNPVKGVHFMIYAGV